MDLDLSDEQALLRDTFAAFLAKEATSERVRAAEPLGFDDALWGGLTGLGAITLAVPEAQGGGGGTYLDLVLVAQELGRRVAPAPFAEAVAAANLLARAEADELLAAVVDGAVPTVALRPAVERRCRLVPAGAVADIVVVLDGEELVALRREGGRPHVDAAPNFGSSPLADVVVDDGGVARTVLATGVEARREHDTAVTEWRLLLAAALDGVRSAALDLTVEYVKSRKAFGVPLGWFQAIQHRLADVAVAGDGGRLLVQRAAWARDEGLPEADDLAAMAFLFLAEVAFKTCAEGVQFHGGYGYTLEYDIQLYFRRAKAWPLALGDPAREYLRLAPRLYPED
jgi:alkylation response protein AidB-like acyl-CoA dehydrogenase